MKDMNTIYISIPNNYPFSAPVVKFAQPCYHPNVSTDGTICLDILTKKQFWTPIQNISSILISIISFLSDPNCSSPLNQDAARMHEVDSVEYAAIVKKVYHKANPKTFQKFPRIWRPSPPSASSTSSTSSTASTSSTSSTISNITTISSSTSQDALPIVRSIHESDAVVNGDNVIAQVAKKNNNPIRVPRKIPIIVRRFF